ncbi:MAG: hypothetical protein BJ554DRAFT_6170 [Olpidium bornovanus]|uniref:Uncharacterized protein n=1 Tax=Olpidium bornovanus TaxID=278681 RepID=A0A8H7ZYB7_9FUNG|nr:MAG: hypothetical protein BJ554DRAFT_6170 [Olpidium bornovanus]
MWSEKLAAKEAAKKEREEKKKLGSRVVIKRSERNKRKVITSVFGLEVFGESLSCGCCAIGTTEAEGHFFCYCRAGPTALLVQRRRGLKEEREVVRQQVRLRSVRNEEQPRPRRDRDPGRCFGRGFRPNFGKLDSGSKKQHRHGRRQTCQKVETFAAAPAMPIIKGRKDHVKFYFCCSQRRHTTVIEKFACNEICLPLCK